VLGPACVTVGSVSPPVLSCDGLRKSYGQRVAVDGVGFHVDAGETYGLLGPNGDFPMLR
jgi:ABC-2 type transport system ATP-binding protein